MNECETPGSCSQICLNQPGSFKCECLPGYRKVSSRFYMIYIAIWNSLSLNRNSFFHLISLKVAQRILRSYQDYNGINKMTLMNRGNRVNKMILMNRGNRVNKMTLMNRENRVNKMILMNRGN